MNGTAVAVPRCIIALCETHQEEGGRRAIKLPTFLGLAPANLESIDASHVDYQTHEANKENRTVTNSNVVKESFAPTIEDDFLEKIMVYKEQCSRRNLPTKLNEDMLAKH